MALFHGCNSSGATDTTDQKIDRDVISKCAVASDKHSVVIGCTSCCWCVWSINQVSYGCFCCCCRLCYYYFCTNTTCTTTSTLFSTLVTEYMTTSYSPITTCAHSQKSVHYCSASRTDMQCRLHKKSRPCLHPSYADSALESCTSRRGRLCTHEPSSTRRRALQCPHYKNRIAIFTKCLKVNVCLIRLYLIVIVVSIISKMDYSRYKVV